MKYFIIFWTIIISKILLIKCELCPLRCNCDLYENQNRAVCSGWKLINAVINIPKNVEIFDLNDNSITTLDNNCFEGLVHLTNLTLKYNSIHTIYLYAFKQLINIKYIDLSYNRLEYIDDRIFNNNNKLIEINLSGNKFMALPNKQLFSSKSLQILLLKNTQITHIYSQTFEWLPSLKYLDLSKNLMITLTITPFNLLRKLTMINLEGNRWICDKNIINVVNLLRYRRVKVEMNDDCKNELNKLNEMNDGIHTSNNNTLKMFERMIIEPKNIDTTSNIEILTTERVRTNVKTIWNNFNNDNDDDDNNCINDDIENICQLYKKCMIKNNEIILKYNTNNNSNSDVSYNSRFFNVIGDVQAFFFIGMSIGAALVFILVTCTICCAKCCKVKSRRKQFMEDISVPTDEFEYIAPPPVPRRLQSRPIVRSAHPLTLNRSMSTPARRTLATNQNDFATFVTRLFERPSRHRYYRTINQNTAHMIRRLSRSNLLNNRLSRHFLEETNRNSTTATNRNREQEVNSLMGQSSDPSVGTELESNTLQARPETPPPPYRDIAMIKY